VLLAAEEAMVPRRMPLPGSMLTPGGKPLAVNVSVLLSLSLANRGTKTLSPTALLWSPGFVSTGAWLLKPTVQVNDWLTVRF
jgi:hypothetical protein